MRLSSSQRAGLLRAISPDRLGTYRAESERSGRDELDLYLWDRDLSAAAMADIAILEVALRNSMSTALERRAERADWYSVDIGLDNRSLAAVTRAWQNVPSSRRTPGRVVAQLTFGFWRNLLEAGGDLGFGPLKRRAGYETLWRTDLHTAFPGGRAVAAAADAQFTRGWTLGVVKNVHALRNRAAHHEPVITGIPLPGESRRITVEDGLLDCLTLAAALDRDLASWLRGSSRLAQAISAQPAVREEPHC